MQTQRICLLRAFSDSLPLVPTHLHTFADGVTLFFVISGFLITSLLLKEINHTKNIDIKKFYLRRILRIWPIYYAYIGIAIVILFCFGIQDDILNNKLYFYLFFLANVPFATTNGLWPIVHYWSIGVEEQFYLFWPWAVKVRKHLLKLTIAILMIWLALKYGSYLFLGKNFLYRFISITLFHCMMIGAIGAILLHQQNRTFLTIFSNKYLAYLAWTLFLCSGWYIKLIPAPCRAEYIAIISLFLITSQILTKNFILNLENRFFDFVGKISYGVYVIHPLIIYVLSKWYSSLCINWPYGIQIALVLFATTSTTIVFASISYYLFEKHFLKLKSRFAVVKSKSSMIS